MSRSKAAPVFYEWWDPRFDVYDTKQKVTKERLTSILLAETNKYHEGKKSELIDRFNNLVMPHVDEKRRLHDGVKRSDHNIKDATPTPPDESTASEEDDTEEEVIPEPTPPPKPRTRRTPARTKAPEDFAQQQAMKVPDSPPRSMSPSKRSTRSKSPVKQLPPRTSKHPRSDTEGHFTEDTEMIRPARKSKKSEPGQTPNVKIKVEDRELGGASRRETFHTKDNPFQQGSSPPEQRRRTLGSGGSRRSTGTPSDKRRHTEGPKAADGIRPPTSRTFEMRSQVEGLTDYDENGVEASEEFTPEAQMELIQEQAITGTVVRRRPKKQEGGLSNALWMIVSVAACAWAFRYRAEKIDVGYCGLGRDAKQLIPDGVHAPDWLRILVEPQCDVCPQHAYCSEQYQAVCDSDFILTQHPLSLGGLLPLPPTCEPDGEKVRRVKAVADRAVEELRERRAKWECGDLVDEAGVPGSAVEIEEAALKAEVSTKRRKGMGEAEFEELWQGAIGEIKGREEVVTSADEKPTLTSTSLARLPLACAIKRSFRLSLARHSFSIASVVGLLSAILYIRSMITSAARTKAAIPSLVSLTLARLANQASLHAHDPDTYPESWISIGQLRDDVLRDEHSLSKRDTLWKKVRKVVEMNANVRASQRESVNGEISRVWEWIGALESITDGSSTRRRKSGRISWGQGLLGEAEDGGTDGAAVGNRWDEARPIY